jgi:hypothetical protein
VAIVRRHYDDFGVGVIYAKLDDAKPHQPVPFWKFFPIAGAQVPPPPPTIG